MSQPDFQQLSFSSLPDWERDCHKAAFDCFVNSANKVAADKKPPRSRQSGVEGVALSAVLEKAIQVRNQINSDSDARKFFETYFRPVRIPAVDNDNQEWPGLLTAYYEPRLQGSLHRTSKFSVPLLRRPSDLVEIKSDSDREQLPERWPAGLRFGRMTSTGIVPYFDRPEIEATHFKDGALVNQELELVWLEDRVEAFFVHIQGSACIELADGSNIRVSYDGKSGQDYTPIGKVLKDRGYLKAGTITMQSIKDWLRANPAEQLEILHQNQSFIFFQEEKGLSADLGPRAAAGVQLTPGRSLAIDRLYHTFHTPIYVSSKQGTEIEHRLMIAQDTGSAIVGPHRGDYFSGSGENAGSHAGGVARSAHFVLLMPSSQLGQ